jgi:xanthine/uracil permease
MVPLFINELNDTFNLSTEEAAVLVAHIPDVVIIGILLIAFIAAAMMGYGFGRQGKRALAFKALFAVMLVLALGLILDLDRPQRGLVRVNLAPLQNVQRLMQAGIEPPASE